MNANARTRLLVRTAARLHAQYVARSKDELMQRLEPVDGMLCAYVDELRRTETLLTRAHRRGLHLCQRRLRQRYERSLQGAVLRLDQMQRRWNEPWPKPPTQRELYEELVAAFEEFGGVDCDWHDKTISVHTDRIVLEGLSLGSFRIVMRASLIARSDPSGWYCIEAMEPNPASSNEEIVHPHVDGDQLCAGDALVPIGNALRQGRLCDFFVLVRSVLETYNPHSAYVELENWDGVSCHDCGYVVDSDNSYYCESCEHSFCDECMSICEVCHTTQCRGCLMRSELSGMCVCDGCCARCSGCDQLCTLDELDDELCSSCLEERDEQEITHDDNQQTTRKDHVDCGQTPAQAVPAAAVTTAAPAGADAVCAGVAQTPVPVPCR